MKRTRETIFYAHPNAERGARTELSGAHTFDGEDDDAQARKRRDQAACRAALNQQMEEKKQAKAMEANADK